MGRSLLVFIACAALAASCASWVVYYPKYTRDIAYYDCTYDGCTAMCRDADHRPSTLELADGSSERFWDDQHDHWVACRGGVLVVSDGPFEPGARR